MKGIHYETNQSASRSLLLLVLTSSIRRPLRSFRSVFEKCTIPYGKVCTRRQQLIVHGYYNTWLRFWPVKELAVLSDGPTRVVKWRGVGVHLLGTTVWQGQLYLLRRREYTRPNMTLYCTSDSLLAYRLKSPWQNPSTALQQQLTVSARDTCCKQLKLTLHENLETALNINRPSESVLGPWLTEEGWGVTHGGANWLKET